MIVKRVVYNAFINDATKELENPNPDIQREGAKKVIGDMMVYNARYTRALFLGQDSPHKKVIDAYMTHLQQTDHLSPEENRLKGHIYRFGLTGQKADNEKALQFYGLAARAGDVETLYHLASLDLQVTPINVLTQEESDKRKSSGWLKATTENSNRLNSNMNGYLQNLAGDYYRKRHFSEHQKPTDLNDAITHYQKSAETGYVTAQYNLALSYEERNGPGDAARAIDMHKNAAAQGLVKSIEKLTNGTPDAQSELGYIYYTGSEAINRDLIKAVNLLEKAETHGAHHLDVTAATAKSELETHRAKVSKHLLETAAVPENLSRAFQQDHYVDPTHLLVYKEVRQQLEKDIKAYIGDLPAPATLPEIKVSGTMPITNKTTEEGAHLHTKLEFGNFQERSNFLSNNPELLDRLKTNGIAIEKPTFSAKIKLTYGRLDPHQHKMVGDLLEGITAAQKKAPQQTVAAPRNIRPETLRTHLLDGHMSSSSSNLRR